MSCDDEDIDCTVGDGCLGCLTTESGVGEGCLATGDSKGEVV